MRAGHLEEQAEQHHFADARVDGQLRQVHAQLRQLLVLVQRANLLQQLHRVRHRALLRRVGAARQEGRHRAGALLRIQQRSQACDEAGATGAGA